MEPVEAGAPRQLHLYWIRFREPFASQVGFFYGCGVTACSGPDALSLIRAVRPFEDDLVVSITTGVSLAELDRNHVIPNIGDTTRRGVWYPNFDETKPCDVLAVLGR